MLSPLSDGGAGGLIQELEKTNWRVGVMRGVARKL